MHSAAEESTLLAALHGDGVKDVACRVMSLDSAFRTSVRRGAKRVSPLPVPEDERVRLVRATIGAPGGAVHSLVEREQELRGNI